MAYCMYLRKSRADLEAEARGEGETLSRHQSTLMLLADRLGIAVAPGAIYREIVSGDTIAARPMMQRLLQEVQDGLWEGVLCTEVERLARGDTIDQGIVAQAFKYSGTRIITPAKIYDPANEMDEEYFEFSLFMARREYKAIKRRMQAGRAASVREGHYVGGKRPFGYEVVKIKGGKGCTLQQIPEEAAIVRQCYDWYLSGMGAQAIARRINAMGVTTYNGHTWDAGSVRNMLYQPVYAGFVQWHKREQKIKIENGQRVITRPKSENYIRAKGLHEPIVTPEEFDRVRELAAQRQRLPNAKTRHMSNPLSGLIKCGLCGYAITRRNNPRGTFLVCRNPACVCSSAYMDAVLANVLDQLRDWVRRYDGQQLADVPAEPQRPDPAPAIAIAQQSIAAARAQIVTAQEMLERRVYTVDEYLERKAALMAKVESAQAEIARLQTPPDAPQDRDAQIIRALPQVKHALAAWPYASTAEDQNALLRSCLSRVEYSKTARGLRNSAPLDSAEIVLYPLLTL